MSGKLYLVATPIGNLGDLSPRAAQVLGAVDFIAAEDTRVTAKLLNHLGVKKPMVSYYEHNMRERGAEIIARLLAGESCAQCSDAGTPAVSDPGELLVRQAIEAGIAVEPVPGPCAAITALCASGLATGRFCFEGFLSVNKKSRREHLAQLKDERRTMIFYEAPHKLRATLRDLYELLGDRPLTIARELTKLHEEIRRTTLCAANELYAAQEPRGEYVLVVEGAPAPEPAAACGIEQAVALARSMMAQGMRAAAACKAAAAQTGQRKSEIYARLSEVKAGEPAQTPNGEAPGAGAEAPERAGAAAQGSQDAGTTGEAAGNAAGAEPGGDPGTAKCSGEPQEDKG